MKQLIAFYAIILLIMGFVGFVKFMAWWHVAFGGCRP